MDLQYFEKTISTKRIFEGNVINLRVDTIALPDGKNATREVVEHRGGVCILALDKSHALDKDNALDEGHILFVRQFRKPLENELLEIPAGKLEKGEDHRNCALRELKEETGYTAGRFEYLGGAYLSPGYSSELIHMYFASDLTKGEACPDQDEFLEVLRLPVETVMAQVASNEIRDGKTLAAIAAAIAKGYITLA